ncbi:hypothetical protein ACKW6Q_12210 [Chryseobacterium kwangjuense]|uniref:Knr4/Smi1-like domain-containing protein n=1 Tax=Chryseobacterium kwangjuense TaxID=267125 RepID=A0ABW9K324_9FLAO
MKVFNFFKKKDSPVAEEKVTVPDVPTHPFLERCEYLKNEFGLIIPEVYKTFFTRHKVAETNYFYSIFWEERRHDDYELIFYTEDFVRYVINRFDETFGDEADYELLQEILENGECEFVHRENKFSADHMDLSFLDTCYEERGRNQEDLMIVLELSSDCGGGEYLILTGDKKGYSGGCYHGMDDKIEHQGHTIYYRILNHYRLVSDRILNKI